MTRIKKSSFLLEIFSIIFAVLLALALDSWRENLAIQKRAQQALNDIYQEINNMQGISYAIDFNQKALNSIDSLLEHKTSLKEDDRSINFMRHESNDLAWRVALQSGDSRNFDRVVFLDLTYIYEERSRLVEALDYFSEFELKSDPELTVSNYLKHKRKQINRVNWRSRELERKVGEFLLKYPEGLANK